jgi:uncharacterized protein YkwD
MQMGIPMLRSQVVAAARPSRRRQLVTALAASLAAASGLLVHPGTAHAATTAEAAAATSVLRMLNAERAAHRLPALGSSQALISSAHLHNVTMAQANLLSHQLPGEAVFSTRIERAGVPWHSAAENVGWTTARTTAGADGLQNSMYNETAPNNGHRLNILSTSVRFVGIDVLIDARTGKLWLTEDFADVRGPVPAPMANHNPFGYYDSAVALTGHRARLRGWAVDPDNRALPRPIAVYYDGRPVAWFRFAVARPDVAKYRTTGPNQGFDITLTLPAGLHSVCVYAGNAWVGTASPKLGCRTVRT